MDKKDLKNKWSLKNSVTKSKWNKRIEFLPKMIPLFKYLGDMDSLASFAVAEHKREMGELFKKIYSKEIRGNSPYYTGGVLVPERRVERKNVKKGLFRIGDIRNLEKSGWS